MQGISNSNVTMKFVQLHYLYHKTLGRQKMLCPLCPKVGRTCSPSLPQTRFLLQVMLTGGNAEKATVNVESK